MESIETTVDILALSFSHFLCSQPLAPMSRVIL